MIEPLIDRANQLIRLNRFEEAEKELRGILSMDPNHTHAIALFSLCLCEQGKLAEAIRNIHLAVGKEPDNDFYLYLNALFLFRNDNLKEAQELILNAIRFQPHHAEYFGLLASVHLSLKEWTFALDSSNQGLAIDPDNLTCLNTRSTALFKLNKKDEAYATIEKALLNDPQNDVTHSNIGWGLLEKGDHKRALEHFSASLRINPNSAYAKAGLVEGLKARYWFYKLFLKYAFWLSNMKSKGQWMVILGLYFGVKLLQVIAASNAFLALIITPLIFLYIIFAVSTWIIGPLSNLFLRLNVYGKYALDKEEIESSNYVAMALCVGLAGGLLYIFEQNFLYLMILIYGITMMIPLASMLNPKKPKSKKVLITYAVSMALIGLLSLIQYAYTNEVGLLAPVYMVGIFAYGWIANAILIRS
ncbi:MAG: tetratricopeptide repeat protein [Cyclobacteriaceae bacterium]